MGRPLKAKYANTTYVNGVQEMSNTDISSLIVPLISQYLVDNYSNPASIGLGQTLTIQLGNPAWGSNVFSGGNISDTKATTLWGAPVVIGDHPVTNTSSFGVSLWQNLNTTDPFTEAPDLGANRPLQTVSSGGVRRIQSMTDTQIENDIVSNVVSTMITGGLGAYWLGTTAPVDGGTWVVRSSILYDTYNGPSGEITTNYYLWQKTATGGSIGTIRPLKRSANNQLQEMSNTDIVNLASHIRKYTVNTGIGLYIIGPSAPGTGTWIARGSFVDTRNVLTDDSYSGSYLGTFSGAFTGQYTGAFSGSYQGGYSRIFTGVYAGSYLGNFLGSRTKAFSREFTGSYTRAFSGNYTGTYNATYAGGYVGTRTNSFARLFTGAYTSSVYTREFSASYTGNYVAPFSGTSYAGTYTLGFISSYLSGGGFIPTYTASYTGAFTGSYVNSFNGVFYSGVYGGTYRTGYIIDTFGNTREQSFSRDFTGTWTGLYAGSRENTFGGSYNQTFVGIYYQAFSGLYSGSYATSFVGYYSGNYLNTFVGSYEGVYNQAFSGVYGNSFSRLFTGAYSGLTVSSSTVTTTYTLWVRTA